MITTEQIGELSSARMDLVVAKASGTGISIAKERMKNLLFNYYDDLINAAINSIQLSQDVQSLENALEESDQENKELRDRINKMSQPQTSSRIKKE